MVGLIITCIGIFGLLVMMTIGGYLIDWKIGLAFTFIFFTIVGVMLMIFV